MTPITTPHIPKSGMKIKRAIILDTGVIVVRIYKDFFCACAVIAEERSFCGRKRRITASTWEYITEFI